ncbi:MAG: penicillin-binding protein, partial [Mesorhizobium sp.]
VGFTGNYTAAVWMGNDDFSQTRNMTGGSLPAMVWQRLMAYAHQNIDLKPIPGIDHPFVDDAVAAKAEEAQKKQAEEDAAKAAAERPPVLSSRTTQMLRELTRLFQVAPPLAMAAEPETLSAL